VRASADSCQVWLSPSAPLAAVEFEFEQAAGEGEQQRACGRSGAGEIDGFHGLWEG